MNEIALVDGAAWVILEGPGMAAAIGPAASPYLGYIYVLEFGDGIKIGSTAKPAQRLKALASMATNYADAKVGRALVSPPHTNFRENERKCRAAFAAARIASGELFRMTLDDFMSTKIGLVFLDESADKDAKGEAFLGFMKGLMAHMGAMKE